MAACPLPLPGKEVVECPITGLFKICKMPSTPGTSTCPRFGSSSPKARNRFKGGSIWGVIVNIHDAVRAIGLALLVLFFVVGVHAYLRQLCRGKETGARL